MERNFLKSTSHSHIPQGHVGIQLSTTFSNICHGFILPIHKFLYNQDAPRFSQEAKVCILPVAIWFGEETFMYIKAFGNITSPHVLPYYVLEKLMAREIAYQTTSEGGMSKALKE